MFRFNPTSAKASNMTFAAVFYNGVYVGCYAGGLPELHYICVTDVWKRLNM